MMRPHLPCSIFPDHWDAGCPAGAEGWGRTITNRSLHIAPQHTLGSWREPFHNIFLGQYPLPELHWGRFRGAAAYMARLV